MSNPKYNPQKDHTREKLQIFAAYLRRYLTILHYAKYRAVRVYDMFAGRGQYGDDTGSALRAAEIVKEHRESSGIDARLHLNENAPDAFRVLCEHAAVISSDKWLTCTQKDANKAIAECLADRRGIPKLFYLDPFGYSQINKSTLDAVCCEDGAECLLFMPVTRIAQFISKRKDNDEQVRPIAQFLNDYGINVSEHRSAKWRDWGGIIKDALVNKYSQKFVGLAVLQAERSTYHALYFVGHIYGLDKFLESVNRIQKDEHPQLELFVSNDADVEKFLSTPQTNHDIYAWGLRQGWTPSYTRNIFKDLEKRGRILVCSLNEGMRRRKGNFYLKHEHYKMSPKIKVKVKSDHVVN